MQVNTISKSINFNATIGGRLQKAIDNNYSSFQKIFSNEYKRTINKITNATSNNDIIDMKRNGDIFIFGKDTNWHKNFITQAKYKDGDFYIDEQVADEIVKILKN